MNNKRKRHSEDLLLPECGESVAESVSFTGECACRVAISSDVLHRDRANI